MAKHFSTATLVACLTAAGLAALPTAANALVVWSLTSSGCTTSGSGAGNTRTCGSNTTGVGSVESSAWANTTNSNTTLDQATINPYSGGLGITHADGETTASPQHAMDNDTRFEVLLFDFGSEEVRLEEVYLGWIGPYWGGVDSSGAGDYEDADLSVLAYKPGVTDPTDPTAAIDGAVYNASAQDLTTSGWELLGNYGIAKSTSVPDQQSINLGNDGVGGNSNVSSSYWLVGAYNPIFGGCTDCDWGAGAYDFFKLKKLMATVVDTPIPPNAVAVPQTLFLALLTLIPVLIRKRGKAA